MLVRFLSPLPITITSRRGTKCTLSLSIESSSDRRELIMTEEGHCGYRIFHNFSPHEYGKIDEILRSGIEVRPESLFARCCRAMASEGLVELTP